MAVYTVENTSKCGKPCRVFDATGVEVVKCARCDDVTGEVERFALNDDGKPIIDQLRNEVVRIVEMRPLPLRVESF